MPIRGATHQEGCGLRRRDPPPPHPRACTITTFGINDPLLVHHQPTPPILQTLPTGEENHDPILEVLRMRSCRC